jgi:hypothetical protein
MLVATTAAGAAGALVGPIALLTFQGGAYVAAGVFVLLTLAPRAVRSTSARAAEPA